MAIMIPEKPRTFKLKSREDIMFDALAKLPNIANYCRQVGLTAPMENITRLFSGGAKPPVTAASASEKGYDVTSFITLNGVLTMPPAEANLLMGETNIMSAMGNAGGSKLGKAITAGIGVVAVLWMVVVLGWWGMLEMQKNNDIQRLGSKDYVSAKELIEREQTVKTQYENIENFF